MNSRSSSDTSLHKGRMLLVQCCHLPQFFYAASLLRRRYPDVRLDALVKRSGEVEFCLEKLNPFTSVLDVGSVKLGAIGYDQVVFPCLNHGYSRIKHLAWELPGNRVEIDYSGRLRPLSGLCLVRSLVSPLHQPNAPFREYLVAFPHPPLAERVLFVESCHPSLVKASEPSWRQLISEPCKLTHVSAQPFFRTIRRLRKGSFDSAIVFFSGETGFLGVKALPFLLRVPRILAINETGDLFSCTAGNLLRFLYQRLRFGPTLPSFATTILFIQTERIPGSLLALRTIKSRQLFPESEVVVVCREEDAHEFREVSGVDRVLALRKGAWLKNWHTFRTLRHLNPEIVSAVLSGRAVFRKAKLLFFLLCDRPALVFNPGMECYFLSLRNVTRIFSREPFVLEEPTPSHIVVVQTEHSSMVRESIARLLDSGLFPEARIKLVCKAQDAPFLGNLRGVEVVFHFPERLAGWIRLARQLRKERPDLISLIFSGRPVFSLHKLWVLLIFPFRSKLAFNARLDAYWLGLTSLPRIFRQEPLLIESEGREILLVQTDDASTTIEVLENLLSSRVIRCGRIRLLCRADDRHRYLSLIPEKDVTTWTPGWSIDNLKRLIQLWRAKHDLVAATFSGRPIFRLQKLVFFLLPARDRLAFNENLDCLYIARSGLGRALRLPSFPVSFHVFGRRQLLRRTGKLVLWIPRFLYLLAWLTIEKLKRARRLV